jgi:hypothetical protein
MGAVTRIRSGAWPTCRWWTPTAGTMSSSPGGWTRRSLPSPMQIGLTGVGGGGASGLERTVQVSAPRAEARPEPRRGPARTEARAEVRASEPKRTP